MLQLVRSVRKYRLAEVVRNNKQVYSTQVNGKYIAGRQQPGRL